MVNKAPTKIERYSDIYYIFLIIVSAVLCITFGAFPSLIIDLDASATPDSPDVVESMKNPILQFALVVEMSVSAFIILEISIDHVAMSFRTFSKSELGVILILLSLFATSTLTLFVCIPKLNYLLMYGIFQSRVSIMAGATLLILKRHDTIMWSSPFLMIGALGGGVGTALAVLQNSVISSIGILIEGLFTALMFFYGIRWLSHIILIYRQRRLNSTEINCTMMLGLFLGIVFCLWITFSASGFPTLQEYNVQTILNGEIFYTVFIISISMHYTRYRGREVLKYQNELEFKRMFVRYISHEVRTPLNTAIIGLRVLFQEMHEQSEHIETVKDIQISCDIAVTVLNEMLTFDKLEAGTLLIEKRELDAVQLINDTVQPFMIQAREKNILLRLQDCIEEALDLDKIIINVDENKIAQVIRNLVSNGLKFSPCGGVVDVNITLEMYEVEKVTNLHLRVDVIDHGAGISKENQKKLFKDIVQFHPSKLQKGGGSGLGLYISHGIVNLHKGSLEVSSDGEECGSTFTLHLPICNQPAIEKSPSQSSLASVGQNSLHNPGKTNQNFRMMIPKNKTNVRKFSSIYISDSPSGTPQVPQNKNIMNEDYLNSLPANVWVEEDDANKDDPITSSNFQLSMSPSDRQRSLFISDEKDDNNDVMKVKKERKLSYEMSAKRNKSLKVLVVDDAAIGRRMVCRLLRTRFGVCEEAENGLEAVKKVFSVSTSYDIILMDCNMPVMNGMEAANELREGGYKGVIIGVTGNVTQEDISEFISHGADAVLPKPLDIDSLESVVKRL